MAELRNAFKLKLISYLEQQTGFYGEDFSFETQQLEESNILFTVKNKFNMEIYFKIILSTEKQTFKDKESKFAGSYNEIESYAFDVTMSPGEFLAVDNIICNGENALYDTFEKWSIRAWDEFNASSIIQRFKIQEKKIEELNEQMGTMGEEYFTVKEAEKLKDRLEELEKILQEHIELVENDETKKNEELRKLSTDIEFLTNNIMSLNKKNWLQSFFARFSPMKLDGEKRKKLLQLGGKGIGMLIEAKTGDSSVKHFMEEITK